MVPGHEKLGHDHSTQDSWNTPQALANIKNLATVYKKLNPDFEMIVGSCYIPEHDYHAYSVTNGMRHYVSGETSGVLKEAVKAFKEFQDTGWVLVFKDRIIVVNIFNFENVKEKLLSR
ncbi:MAG TPA: hypothetical protein VNJ08_02000 [Bacteriovoracaceae bacterium]|nr:hypothetical protein [Bacteriovoracaceae bacterium]